MGQVTIYLDDESERLVKRASSDEGIPVSRWIARLIKQHAANAWSEEVREMAGSWSLDESGNEIEYAQDMSREPL